LLDVGQRSLADQRGAPAAGALEASPTAPVLQASGRLCLAVKAVEVRHPTATDAIATNFEDCRWLATDFARATSAAGSVRQGLNQRAYTAEAFRNAEGMYLLRAVAADQQLLLGVETAAKQAHRLSEELCVRELTKSR